MMYLQSDYNIISVNKNTSKSKLIISLLSVGLYPNIAYVLKPPKTFVEVIGGNIQRDTEAQEFKLVISPCK